MIDASKPIVLADQEIRSGVPAALEPLGVSVRYATLRTGDYVVGQTGIERKTVPDLHASVVSGRFWVQLNRLRAVSAFPIVIVEGHDLDSGPLRSIRGILVALCDRGIPVLRSMDPIDSARWIRSLAASPSNVRRARIQAPYRKPVGRRDPVSVAMLSAVPGVSIQSARNLVDSFRTLQAVARSSPAELRAVPGIGPRRSTAIHAAFNHLF